MSGTLVSAADRLFETYRLSVGELPPNRPCIRVDEPDHLFRGAAERDAAAIRLIMEAHERGQPVLVGTQSVIHSEAFARSLSDDGFVPVVLNAKNDASEARIIAQAGHRGQITVSTQMAGRGTDIQLDEGVSELGGLLVVGLGRFSTRRLDDQLRGRSGRQGDPGRSVFLTSLEDDVVVNNTDPVTVSVADDGTVLDAKITGPSATYGSSFMDHAQRVAQEKFNDLTDLSLRYGRLIALQRTHILKTRDRVLHGDLAWDLVYLKAGGTLDELASKVDPEELKRALRSVVLRCLDWEWSQHLAYSVELREGIHLRRLGGDDPLAAFNSLIARNINSLVDKAINTTVGIIKKAQVIDGKLVLQVDHVYRPGATWTYMVTDIHFNTAWENVGMNIRKMIR